MSNLTNIGYDLGLNTGPIRRLIFTLTLSDAGAVNSLSLSNAAAIANWRTKFNTYNFAADPSVKFVCTPLVYQGAFPSADATTWQVEDYIRKMRNAPSDVEFHLLDVSPYILKNLAELEDQVLSVYFVTEDNKVMGILDGANLVPFPLQTNSLSVPYYNPAGYETGSDNTVKFRLSSGSDRNKIVCVEVADGSVTDASDFIALRNVTGTITSPAVTGCVITTLLVDVNPASPSTVTRMTGAVYGEITFTDQATPFATKTLAAAGSLTEVSGVYTVNEAVLLTSGKTYTCKIAKSCFDVTCGNVAIP